MSKMNQRILLFAAFVAPLGAKFLAIHTPIGELSLFRISIILAFVFSVASERGKIRIYSNNRTQKQSINFFLLLFAYGFISILWSRDLSSWFRSMFFLAIAVMAILLYTLYFQDRTQLIKPIKALCFGILIQAIIGWSEVFTRVYIFRPEAETLRPVIGLLGIPVAMQYNSNNFALMMFFGSALAIICLIYNKKTKVFYIACATNFALLAFLTASRAIIIAYLIAGSYLLFKIGKKKVIFFILPLIIVLIYPQTISYIQEILHFDFSEGHNSDYVRANLIKNGLLFLVETFGFGVGAGQIPYWMQNKAEYYTYNVFAMHNFWIELLTSYGLVIFAGFMVYYVRMFRNYHLESISKTTMGAVICAVLLGFIIGGVGPSSTMSLEWLWLFWGICIAGQSEKKETVLIK